ncbi:antigen identified by monoclonal antibody Ki-67 [Xylographa soralifera]|nr:antigen identified by monoclonal antibody Ki-67 [Xylographa soralifera]
MAPPPGKLLGLTFNEWYTAGYKNGIMAVIDRWGDPLSYKKNFLKQALLEIAWTALQNFNPRPTQTEVRTLISNNNPGPQVPATRAPIAPTPQPVAPIAPSPQPVTPKAPKPPSSQGSSSKSGTDGHGRPSGASTGTPSGPPSQGIQPKDSSRVYFTINQPHYDPQLEDGLEIQQENFHSQLKGLLSRYFHRVCVPSDGEEEELPPLRPVSDFGDLSQLLLDDVFDNKHDPCVTSYKLAFRDFPARDYQHGRTGRDYSCRGRGPVWQANSCALDTVLVVAKLLDIGRIREDTGLETWQEFLGQRDAFGQDCLRIFREPWDILTAAESIRRRDEFYHQAIEVSKSRGALARLKGHGLFQSSLRVWDLCTEPAMQFRFSQFSRSFCISCKQQTRLFPEHDGEDIHPPKGTEQRDITFRELEADSTERPDMGQMLTRHFEAPDPSMPHKGCTGAAAGQITVQRGMRILQKGGLPARLVVKPGINYRNIRGATNDRITFTYSTLEGEPPLNAVDPTRGKLFGPWQQTGLRKRTVTYRWLGGIYKHKEHYRVYWQDSEYFVSNGNVKVYDGKLFGGAIVGEFPPCEPGFKVPTEWSEGADVLFYELINESDRDAVMAVAQKVMKPVLADMAKQAASKSPAVEKRAATQPAVTQPAATQPAATPTKATKSPATKKPAAPPATPTLAVSKASAATKKPATSTLAVSKASAATKKPATSTLAVPKASAATKKPATATLAVPKSPAVTPASTPQDKKRPADGNTSDGTPRTKKAKITKTTTTITTSGTT